MKREGFLTNYLDLQSGTVPATPQNGYFRLYRRNGTLAYLDDAGVEHPLGERLSGSLITLKEDFLSGNVNGSIANLVTSTGTGGSTALSAYESSPSGTMRVGVHSASVATASNSRVGSILGNSLFLFGDGIVTLTFFVRLSSLATIADDFTMLLGFLDNGASATQTDGVFFRYNFSNANLIGVTSNNNTQSTVTTTKVMDTNWNRYDININADGTLATFYVNGISVGTLNTNIPTTAGRETSIGYGLHRVTSGTAKTMYIDMIELLAISTNPR